jgi:hypothetical protein
MNASPPPLPPNSSKANATSPYEAPQSHTSFPAGPAHGANQGIGQNAGMRVILPVGQSGWAIAAGYLGLLIFPGPLAIVLSIIAWRDIHKSKLSGTPKHGMMRVIVGLGGGLVGTVLWVIAIGSLIA